VDPVSFWLIALGIPLTAIIGNSIIRLLVDLPQSAPADTVLAFVVFDAVAIMQAEDFRKFVVYSVFQEAFVSIYVFLILLGMFGWGISVFSIERQISDYYRSAAGSNDFPFTAFFFALFIPVALIFASITPFAYKGAA
jgi:hypothetical protein